VCLSKPNIPAPVAPPPVQETKLPDTLNAKRRTAKAVGMGGGTLLTGPSGIASSALNTGGSTLLGG
jgi:hypothetical protein